MSSCGSPWSYGTEMSYLFGVRPAIRCPLSKRWCRPFGKNGDAYRLYVCVDRGCCGIDSRARFQALGRVRFEYDDGYWDEWYLAFDDGTDGWLEEDEGELALVSQVPMNGTPPHPNQVRAGERVTWGDASIYVMETGTATLVGMEVVARGHFIGLTMDYLDGTMDGQVVMLGHAQRNRVLYRHKSRL